MCSMCNPIDKEAEELARQNIVKDIKKELKQETTKKISHKAFVEQLEAVGVPVVCHPMLSDL